MSTYPTEPASSGNPFKSLNRTSKGSGMKWNLEEKFQAYRAVYIEGQDPNVAIPPFYQRHGCPVPLNPKQGITTFPRELEHLVNVRRDPEAIRLAEKYLPEMKNSGGAQ